ncbi:MAG TPA: acetyl-CoA carboxylase, carboxyltransferase subunit beta, partial [Xanthobacteraceae bacterium]|nr:acetyl-CoA carboxylase, carboxyltransferase subunit beta [Xanthobacteraceae bacterium]
MSWLSRVRSGIPFLPKRQSAENLWHKCARCGTMVFLKEWEENYSVCPRCDFHDRIGPAARFEQLFDAAKFEILPSPEVREDPLRFKDSKRYSERLKAARTATGERDALINARGKIDSHKVVLGVQDFAFMGGSMGIAVGAAFVAGVRAEIADRAPYVIFTASGGARMQEAVLSLMQLPRTTVALAELHEAGLPYIVVLTDPTTGGVTASYAMLGDVQIAEPGALIGFAGQRVIEQTIREKLPEGFQRAEYLLAHGIIDMVVPRSELKEKLALLIS